MNNCAVCLGGNEPLIGRSGFVTHEISCDRLRFPARRFVVGKFQAFVIKDWARSQVESVKGHTSKRTTLDYVRRSGGKQNTRRPHPGSPVITCRFGPTAVKFPRRGPP